jgi:hypothetical protein
MILFLPLIVMAKFASNNSCKSCHPLIYAEYQRAMHSKSTVFKDKVHNSAWKISPSYKKRQYFCGRCHTPADTTLMGAMEYNLTMVPDINSTTGGLDAVSCSYCHRIQDIKHSEIQNYNIVNKKEKIYFGNLKNPMKNPFHKTGTNRNFKNGNVCIGCHSHYKNSYGVNICSTNDHNELDSANCVSCHMPKVSGSPSNLNEREEHSFHGFAGIHNDISMLSKYVSIEILRGIDRFFIAINNKSPHALTLHPMRVMELRVLVIRDKNVTRFEPKDFVRLLGVDNNMTSPWDAKELIKNTSIKGNEKRVSTYMYALKEGDVVNVELGYHLLNKKVAKSLGLEDDERLNKFILLRQTIFTIK